MVDWIKVLRRERRCIHTFVVGVGRLDSEKWNGILSHYGVHRSFRIAISIRLYRCRFLDASRSRARGQREL
jgi:hypothetical protein